MSERTLRQCDWCGDEYELTGGALARPWHTYHYGFGAAKHYCDRVCLNRAVQNRLNTDGAKSIYISGPLTTAGKPEENLRAAMEAAIRLIEDGWIVFCPHLSLNLHKHAVANNLPEFGWDEWMEQDLYWLDRCDVVYMLPGWRESAGALAEHKRALQLGKDVIYGEAE